MCSSHRLPVGRGKRGAERPKQQGESSRAVEPEGSYQQGVPSKGEPSGQLLAGLPLPHTWGSDRAWSRPPPHGGQSSLLGS